MRERFINVIEGISTNRISVEVGAAEIESLLRDGLMGEFEGYKRSSVRFFIMCLDAYDPNIPPARNAWGKWKMDWRRVNADFAYPSEEVRKQASRLLKVLRGEESVWGRIMFFFTN